MQERTVGHDGSLAQFQADFKSPDFSATMPSAMNMAVAMVAPSDGGGLVGPLILIFIFLLLTAGLVLVVRLMLAGLRGSRVPRGRRDGGADTLGGAPVGGSRPRAGMEQGAGRPVTGRILKQRYLSGKISQAEYDEQLRRLQIEEFLEDEK